MPITCISAAKDKSVARPAMIETRKAKLRCIDKGDYTLVCYRELLILAGETNLPETWEDMFPQQPEGMRRDFYGMALDMSADLFGEWNLFVARDCTHAGERLYQVEKLTLKESAIAARTDLTHPEKIDLIRPLREKRRAASDAYWDRLGAKQMAGREERIRSAGADVMEVSDEDRDWAARSGLSLD